MVRELKIYVCSDGKRFDDLSEAENYDKILEKVNKLMSVLHKTHSNDYAIRQDRQIVQETWKQFCIICSETIKHYGIEFKEIAEEKRHISHMEYILNNWSNEYPILWKTFFRFKCISKNSGIEYPQPYYTEHESVYTGRIY